MQSHGQRLCVAKNKNCVKYSVDVYEASPRFIRSFSSVALSFSRSFRSLHLCLALSLSCMCVCVRWYVRVIIQRYSFGTKMIKR